MIVLDNFYERSTDWQRANHRYDGPGIGVCLQISSDDSFGVTQD